MEKTNASKQGVLHWLDENFEKMFLVTGLLSITLFITWQVIYRYIITQFIDAPVPPYGLKSFPVTSLFGFPTRPERRHQKAFVHPWTCSTIICPRACSRSAGSWSRCCSSS